MEEEKKCKQCSRVLERDYQFCPYCGTLVVDIDESLFEGVETGVEEKDRLEKLVDLEASLDLLEDEIKQFLSSNIH